MNSDFELLVEKEAIWARMLEEVLRDNGIPCVAVPIYGAGLTIRAGVRERLKIYVPKDRMPEAKALREELFAADAVPE